MPEDDIRERLARLEVKQAADRKDIDDLAKKFEETKAWGLRTVLAIMGTLMMAYWDRIKDILLLGAKG